MLRVYEDHLVGPVPKFPREIEEGIDDYLEMRALLLASDEAAPRTLSP
jgi:hypothetical protein